MIRESTSIYKYRIKKRWKINKSGIKTIIYFPQYKDKLYGWRYMHEQYEFDDTKLTLVPIDSPSTILVLLWGVFGTIIGVVMLFLQKFEGLIVLPLSLLLLYLGIWLINMYNTEYLMNYCDSDKAKDYISNRIKLNNKIKENQSKFLPDDEIIYLDKKVERKEKLKQLNKRKFKFWN